MSRQNHFEEKPRRENNRKESPFEYSFTIWEYCNLICSKCKQELLSTKVDVAFYESSHHEGMVVNEMFSSDVERYIQHRIDRHKCEQNPIDRQIRQLIRMAIPKDEPVFRLNQNVIDTNTGKLYVIKDQALADLCNEQRAQGINNHIQPYE